MKITEQLHLSIREIRIRVHEASWVVWQKDKINPFIREARLHVQAQMRGAEPPGHLPSVAWGLGSRAVPRAPEPGSVGSAGPQSPLDCGPPSLWLRGFASG